MAEWREIVMNREKIMAYYYDLAYKNNVPVSVVLELTTKCNLNCEHCYLPKHSNAGLNTKTVTNLLTDLCKLGVSHVLFTGGEILLREDLFELIRVARSLHMRVTLLSNGTLLNEQKIQQLSELFITEFSTTIFSLDSNIHDSITGVNGSLDQLLINLSRLKEHGIRVKLKMPVMKKNRNSIEQVKQFCDDNQFEFLASPTIFPKNDGDDTPISLRLDGIELCEVVKKLDEMNDFKESLVHQREVPCIAIFYSFAIDANGDVFPCNSLLYKVGSIFENSVSEIWNFSERLKKIKEIKTKDLGECSGCDYKFLCERCPGMALLDSTKIEGCDSFARNIAKIRSQCYTV